MAGQRQPSPSGWGTNQSVLDEGTSALVCTPTPGSVGLHHTPLNPSRATADQSETVTASASSAVSIVDQLSYDAFVRRYVYEPGAAALTEAGGKFVRSGVMSSKEAASWVNHERNALLEDVRENRNSPLGREISEYLKPRSDFPEVPELFKKYAEKNPAASEEQIYFAIIKSGARTRASVNRWAVTLRWGGPVLTAVSVSFAVYIVAAAPREQRGRVAAGEVGALLGGLGAGWVGGWVGAKVGCEAGGSLGVWFEGVGVIPGCLVGAFVGSFGAAYAGAEGGRALAEVSWDTAQSLIEWK